jgi:hypothetical protein
MWGHTVTDTTHSAFFGDAEYQFALTLATIRELEKKCGAGFGLIVQRVNDRTFYADDLIEIIRLGLIGAGTDPKQADRLVETYARQGAIEPVHLLATDIVNTTWFGNNG